MYQHVRKNTIQYSTAHSATYGQGSKRDGSLCSTKLLMTKIKSKDWQSRKNIKVFDYALSNPLEQP